MAGSPPWNFWISLTMSAGVSGYTPQSNFSRMALARLAVSSSTLLAASRSAGSAADPASHSTLDARSRTANRGLARSSIAFLISVGAGALARGVGKAKTTVARAGTRSAARWNDRGTDSLRGQRGVVHRIPPARRGARPLRRGDSVRRNLYWMT